MKWLKHMTASWDDERLADLIGSGGKDGLALYGAYWRVCEIVASQMEGKAPSCSVQYTVTRWSLLMSVRGSLLCHYLGQLGAKGLVTVDRTGNDIRVTIPNLLKYRDEYARKSGQSPDSVPPRTDTDTEGEQIQIQKEPLRSKIRAIDPDVAIYTAYPKHIGKRKALKQIELAVKRLVVGEACEVLDAMAARRWLWRKIAAYARSPAAKDAQFVPHPATWFAQSRYLDDEKEWNTTGRKEGGNATTSNHAQDRVSGNRAALRRAAERAGWASADGSDHPDGRPVSAPGFESVAGGVSEGFREDRTAVQPENADSSSGRVAHQARAEVLSSTQRGGRSVRGNHGE